MPRPTPKAAAWPLLVEEAPVEEAEPEVAEPEELEEPEVVELPLLLDEVLCKLEVELEVLEYKGVVVLA